jgi:Na+/proline symporter/nitrogen-specific signal transduction histidine kinase
MLSSELVLAAALAYVTFLFAVAFFSDRRARQGRLGFLQSPLVYTLSLSIYCTAWTFYGAVGSAARNGLEFATIYLGPTLVFVGWWFTLRKLLRIGRVHRVTSIADLISSRYGKSTMLAVVVTLIAVIGTTPYIALQLKALTVSFQVIGSATTKLDPPPLGDADFATAFWIAVGMAVFTIIFGTRNIDANERHHGVVAAIAVEALVKLLALLAVGLFVVLSFEGGLDGIFASAPQALIGSEALFGPRWVTLTFLAAVAIICLPRQFQVMVVENTNEDHLRTASWLFPLYLFLISLFILPIALAGLATLPPGADPDMFVLTLPLWTDQDMLALLAFLGGFSSATSMVIVACIALSTMISNHIVMPIALNLPGVTLAASGDVKRLLLVSRRIGIGVILFLGFLYFRLSGQSDALAAIGLIAFAAVAQLLPSLIGGIYWRLATAKGALAGLVSGFLIWAYTLFLPSFEGGFLLSAAAIEHGPMGIAWLRPEALFGFTGTDPLVHAIFWSLGINTALFVLVSLATQQSPLERVQGRLFIDVFERGSQAETFGYIQRSATGRDLFVLAQRILGANEARRLFADMARYDGVPGTRPVVDDAFIGRLERQLAGNVGAASARAMISQVTTGERISLDALMRIADETQQVIEQSQALKQKSEELESTARQLQAANERLRQLDQQKDDFLSQVSHEVRTPLASIRSFSEILEGDRLDPARARRFAGIIHAESERMTRLLDDILDLSLLERGEAAWTLRPVDAEAALERALETGTGLASQAGVRLLANERAEKVLVEADPDRLNQVFINLLANAIKYNSSPAPEVRVRSLVAEGVYQALVEDNGPGINPADRERIFQKFSRGWSQTPADRSGAGLGLAISWQIMSRLNGRLELLPDQGAGACFRVSLPVIARA